jgi:hypothetical protein
MSIGMQDKQKVTLYLSQELHRRLKVYAALELEPMSDLAERAINFYLAHPEIVEERAIHGHSHRVYDCPDCTNALVMKEGSLISLRNQPGVLSHQDAMAVEAARIHTAASPSGEEKLVAC